MRNVMACCILSFILFAFTNWTLILGQEQNSFLWTDHQIASEDWRPFVPPSYDLQTRSAQNIFVQNHPRSETVRQFFGKNPQSDLLLSQVSQNVQKKSFQAAAPSNTVDQYAIPPIVNSYNTFGAQTFQTRNPLLFEKNIKDAHFFDQSPQHFPKYHHSQQQLQQPQPANQQILPAVAAAQVQRFPAYFPPSSSENLPQQRQPLPPAVQYSQNPIRQAPLQLQQTHFQSSFIPRFENNNIRPNNLLQPVSSQTAIATSVHVFPPQNVQPQRQYTNTYLHNHVPANNAATAIKNDYVNDIPIHDFKLQKANTIVPGSVYNPVLNQKNIQYSGKLEPQHNFYFENGKPQPQEQFDLETRPKISTSEQQSLSSFFSMYGGDSQYSSPAKQVQIDQKPKKSDEAGSMSKHVFEQLSPLGRPFKVTKDPEPYPSNYNYDENDSDPESLSSYTTRPRPTGYYSPIQKSPKNRLPSAPAPVSYHRLPGFNNVYEPGKQTYVKQLPPFDSQPAGILTFNEEEATDVYSVTSEKSPMKSNNFLPTTTDSYKQLHNIGDSGFTYSYFNSMTSSATTISPTDGDEDVPRLPLNHKYHQPVRTRLPVSTTEDPSSKDADSYPISNGNQFNDDPNKSTRRPSLKRGRKPTKIRNRLTTAAPSESESTPLPDFATSTENYPHQFLYTSDNLSTQRIRPNSYVVSTKDTEIDESMNSVPILTTAAAPIPKKKIHKEKAPIKSEDNYPNYPIEYLNQLNNPDPVTEIQSQNNVDIQPQVDETTETFRTTTQMSNRIRYRTTTPQEQGNNQSTTRSTTKSRVRNRYTTTPSSVNASPTTRVSSPRPRFSVKEYRRTTTTSSVSPSAPTSNPNVQDSENDGETEAEKKKNRKQLFASRGRNRTETDSDSSSASKFKPRIRPTRYRSTTESTSSAAPTYETTSERFNVGKTRTSTNSNKYLNRFRITTESADNTIGASSDVTSERRHDMPSESDNSVSASKPTKIKIFSAKRPYALSTTSTEMTVNAITSASQSTSVPKMVDYDDEGDSDEYEDDSEEDTHDNETIRELPQKNLVSRPAYFKVVKKLSGKQQLYATDKTDEDVADTKIMTSSEEEVEKNSIATKMNNQITNRTTETTTTPTISSTSTQQSTSSTTARTTVASEPEIISGEDNEPLDDISLEDSDDEYVPPPPNGHQNSDHQRSEQDDQDDQVSKVSSLTSQDGNGMSANNYIHHWRVPLYSSGRVVTAIKTPSSDY